MVPISFITARSLRYAGAGKAKPVIFITNIPSTAIPRRLSSMVILSCWLTGAAIIAEDPFAMQLVYLSLYLYILTGELFYHYIHQHIHSRLLHQSIFKIINNTKWDI